MLYLCFVPRLKVEVACSETSAPQNSRLGDLLGIDCMKQSPVHLASMFVTFKASIAPTFDMTGLKKTEGGYNVQPTSWHKKLKVC